MMMTLHLACTFKRRNMLGLYVLYSSAINLHLRIFRSSMDHMWFHCLAHIHDISLFVYTFFALKRLCTEQSECGPLDSIFIGSVLTLEVFYNAFWLVVTKRLRLLAAPVPTLIPTFPGSAASLFHPFHSATCASCSETDQGYTTLELGVIPASVVSGRWSALVMQYQWRAVLLLSCSGQHPCDTYNVRNISGAQYC
jgi:hypothetical protein